MYSRDDVAGRVVAAHGLVDLVLRKHPVVHVELVHTTDKVLVGIKLGQQTILIYFWSCITQRSVSMLK